MRIILLLGALASALFASIVMLNAQAIAEPSILNLGVATVQGAPGIVAAALAAAAIVAFAVCLVLQALFAARARRSQAKALEAQRTLAEEAEASRFNQLRQAMVSEFERLAATLTGSQDELRIEIHESVNSIAATLAEIDDRTNSHRPGSAATS